MQNKFGFYSGVYDLEELNSGKKMYEVIEDGRAIILEAEIDNELDVCIKTLCIGVAQCIEYERRKIMLFEKMWELICNALIENREEKGIFTYIRDDGLETKGDMKDWNECSLTSEEIVVLSRGGGAVLDLACGFGKHLKYMKLQQNVKDVLGVEYNEKIAQYVNDCGMHVICDDMCHFMSTCNKTFDIVLIMGNSIAECGSLERVQELFDDIYRHLEMHGKVIVSYKDYQDTTSVEHKYYQENNRERGKYEGCVRIKLEYKGMYSEEKEMCYMDKKTLYHILNSCGFDIEYESKERSWHFTVWEKGC